MRNNVICRILAVNAYELFHASLTQGNEKLFQELKSPKIGDLVLEVSRPIYLYTKDFPGRFDKEAWDADYIGYLRKIDGNGNFTIDRLHDDVTLNWGNARFIKVLEYLTK